MKTQNGCKINPQVSAERRGGCVRDFVEFWGLRRTLRAFVPIFASRLAVGAAIGGSSQGVMDASRA